jgi:hypothetical protein
MTDGVARPPVYLWFTTMSRVSFSIVFVFILTLFPVIVDAAALAARASGSSRCVTTIVQIVLRTQYAGCYASCYQCPPQDNLGFQLAQHSDAGGTLFCSYPAVAGEDPNDFFCRYSDVRTHPFVPKAYL